MQRAINNGSDFMEYAYPGGLRAGSDPQPVPASCRDPDSHSCPRSAHPSANPNSCSGSPYFYPATLNPDTAARFLTGGEWMSEEELQRQFKAGLWTKIPLPR